MCQAGRGPVWALRPQRLVGLQIQRVQSGKTVQALSSEGCFVLKLVIFFLKFSLYKLEVTLVQETIQTSVQQAFNEESAPDTVLGTRSTSVNPTGKTFVMNQKG